MDLKRVAVNRLVADYGHFDSQRLAIRIPMFYDFD